jgi:hypothetical protein
MNLITAVTFPRDGLAFAQAHLPLEGLHGYFVQAEVIGDDGGVYAPPLFELIAVFGNKLLDGGREVNVSHRIAPVAKSKQAGLNK